MDRGSQVRGLNIALPSRLSISATTQNRFLDDSHPRVSCLTVHKKEDPFPKSFALRSHGFVLLSEFQEETADLVHVAVKNRFLHSKFENLQAIFFDKFTNFQTLLSYRPAASVIVSKMPFSRTSSSLCFAFTIIRKPSANASLNLIKNLGLFLNCFSLLFVRVSLRSFGDQTWFRSSRL